MEADVKTDYLIVGSGLTGSVIARLLADEGRQVVVIDRRQHLGGNVFDEKHPSGILMNRYGPHYFRTNSDRIWEFGNRFAGFHPYAAIVKTMVDGECETWPVTAAYIRRTAGESWVPAFNGLPKNFEEESLSKMPRVIYEKFIRDYTQKQWGKDPKILSAKLARRFSIREDDDERLMQHKYQGVPRGGYTGWVKTMLKGIEVISGCDYLKNKDRFTARKVVYTGSIDEFFGYKLGRLAYRSQQRETRYLPDVQQYQVCGQVNYPSLKDGPHIRHIEWRHMMDPAELKGVKGTVVTKETPFTPSDPDQNEYPAADEENALLYQKYQALAAQFPDLVFCGRLATYQYLDMDQAIGRAMACANTLLEKTHDFDCQTH